MSSTRAVAGEPTRKQRGSYEDDGYPYAGEGRPVKGLPVKGQSKQAKVASPEVEDGSITDLEKGIDLEEGTEFETDPVTGRQFRIHYRTIHGYRRAFIKEGSGPALLLIHGIGNDAGSWRSLIGPLSENYTVIAPDLLGHGRSEKPRADYSVAAYACGMRDLLSVLGFDRATVVGHSLGGGVGAQFSYQFPDKCERLVLVASGGISRDVSPLLQIAAAPTSDLVLPFMVKPVVKFGAALASSFLKLSGHKLGRDADELQAVANSLPDATARRAFLRTLRSVVDWRGQVVTMLDRSYLARSLPTLIIWGTHDGVIPTRHAYLLHAAMPGSKLEIFEGAGHFPHHWDPDRFLTVLTEFLNSTEPSPFKQTEWRRLLEYGGPGVSEGEAIILDSLADERAARSPS